MSQPSETRIPQVLGYAWGEVDSVLRGFIDTLKGD
ncbi:hypothetical protein SEA_COLT_13 [Mycobacterium phage Colt]|uniref:Uncharacterized protein n=1 Tax=Mycobacterium phage Cane17 TaxID=2301548 RepID=A0A346N8J2_9CAUD|nr:hypothetical protein KHO59_gp013 [Mycobacterium phage Cane17]AXQ51627.1 hypothetical protein SEA_CANE17_13 [Mycobacterium phage Cane17]QAY13961.1 hypothetical protein SEA_COLT_13 [Mycobacterium phage Colt]